MSSIRVAYRSMGNSPVAMPLKEISPEATADCQLCCFLWLSGSLDIYLTEAGPKTKKVKIDLST